MIFQKAYRNLDLSDFADLVSWVRFPEEILYSFSFSDFQWIHPHSRLQRKSFMCKLTSPSVFSIFLKQTEWNTGQLSYTIGSVLCHLFHSPDHMLRFLPPLGFSPYCADSWDDQWFRHYVENSSDVENKLFPWSRFSSEMTCKHYSL